MQRNENPSESVGIHFLSEMKDTLLKMFKNIEHIKSFQEHAASLRQLGKLIIKKVMLTLRQLCLKNEINKLQLNNKVGINRQ